MGTPLRCMEAGREWEDDTSPRTGTARDHSLWGRGQWENWFPTDSPGEPRREASGTWQLPGGAGPSQDPGPRRPLTAPAPRAQAPPLQLEHGPASATGPLWGPGRAPSLLGAPQVPHLQRQDSGHGSQTGSSNAARPSLYGCILLKYLQNAFFFFK